MRRIQKFMVSLLLVLMVLTTACSKKVDTPTNDSQQQVEVINYDEQVNQLALEMFKAQMTLSPMNATLQIGDLSKYGLENLASELDHMSLEFFDQYYASMDSFDAKVKTIDESLLSPASLRLLNHIKADLESSKEERKYTLDQHPVNQNLGLQTAIPIVLTQLPLTNEEEVQAYLKRISQYPRLMDELALFEEAKIKNKSLMPADIYDKVITQCNDFVAIKAEENTLYLYLNDQLNALTALDATKKSEYLTQCATLINQEIYPSYKGLVSAMEKAKAATTITGGLWQYPDGKAYYAYIVKKETGYDLTPEELNQWATDEFSNGIAKMTALYTRLNKDSLNIEDAFVLDPKYTEFTQLYEILNTIIAANFNSYSVPKVAEKIIPSYLEKDLPEGFYLPITIDGLKLGNMFLKSSAYAQVDFETLILLGHEAIPGHHFQHSVLVNLPLAPYEKVSNESAYIEGWASYCETLISENINTQHPIYAEVLRSNFDLTYALLSMMDYDLHYGGLNRQEVIDKYSMYLGEEADKAVDRALVAPGDSLHYAYGRYKILELRDITQKALGDQFDIKAFHDVILSAGPCTMTDLEKLVTDYIISKVPDYQAESTEE